MRTDLTGLVGLGVREDEKTPKGSDPKETFKTTGGRVVHGGGGITPDVVVKRERMPRVVIEFVRKYLFFDFAVNYAIDRKFPSSITQWEPEPDLLSKFKTFISDTTNTHGYRYTSNAEYRLKELKKSFSNRELSKAETKSIDQLENAAKSQAQAEFEDAREDILNQLSKAIAERVWGEQAKQIAALKGDKQFEEAIRILKNQSLYKEKMALVVLD